MAHTGVGQDTVTGEPPPRGSALKVKDLQGPPKEGGLARTRPLVGPSASAINSVAAPASGMVKGISLPSGVSFPRAEMHTMVAVYLRAR